ncbi:hypothetical protein [Mucisphaera calidilacus]|uniref:Uncharacterized protein n=1 Tax=Mucisphaera calidilacus TaxID=2527982 RepID=A0A518BTI2_9BACT|nr:hypothetical protein [Mucisphaera calidilacus]QDU70278.1 hypothetical protein Pan265_01010 [Mucisphaera calidilacus]
MYSLLETAISAIAPGSRAVTTLRVHVEAQISREPLIGARVRVNSGEWKSYDGPDQPVEVAVLAGRRVRIEVAKPGWIDPRPNPYVDLAYAGDEVHVGLM